MTSPMSTFLLPDSSLSPPVKHIIDSFNRSCELETIYNTKIYKCCINEDDSLNWEILGSVFPNDSSNQTDEWYISAISNLSPAILRISSVLMQYEEVNEAIMEKLYWTGNLKIFQKCFQLMRSDDTILAMQLMTSTLERALGNVYTIKDPVVPFLLKDLLSSNNLKEMIGSCPMQLLQVLMGPPVSLNLRNIVWHGFIAPQELPLNYCWFLFAITIGIGDILRSKDVSIEAIPQRHALSLPQINELKGKFPTLTVEQIKKLNASIHVYEIIPKILLPCWHLIFRDFLSKNFTDCVIRMLPLLENVLRRLFATVNGCSERVLTAQSAVLYTTFDEILSVSVDDEENSLRTAAGDNFLIILNDLLIYQHGPRLRDHLSHGELDPLSITQDLTNHIICIVIVACEISQTCLLGNSHRICEVSMLFECVASYKPVFPPHCLCKTQIEQFLISLEAWKNCVVLKDEKIEPLINSENIHSESKHWLHPSLNRYISVEKDLKSLLQSLLTAKLNVLYRPAIELGKIGHISRISSNSHKLSEQILDNIKLQVQKLCRHEMRSRNRESYNRMIKVIPIIAIGLRITAAVLVDEFLNCDNCIFNNKLFTSVTHYVDNLNVMTNSQKNRWDESGQLTKTFIASLASLIR